MKHTKNEIYDERRCVYSFLSPLRSNRCAASLVHGTHHVSEMKMGVYSSHHTVRIFLQLNKSFSRAPKTTRKMRKRIHLLRCYGLLLLFCVSCGRVASTKRIDTQLVCCVEHFSFEKEKKSTTHFAVIRVSSHKTQMKPASKWNERHTKKNAWKLLSIKVK